MASTTNEIILLIVDTSVSLYSHFLVYYDNKSGIQAATLSHIKGPHFRSFSYKHLLANFQILVCKL